MVKALNLLYSSVPHVKGSSQASPVNILAFIYTYNCMPVRASLKCASVPSLVLNHFYR